MAQFDDHSADLGSCCSHDHGIGAQLFASVDHTDSCERVHKQSCGLLKGNIITYRYDRLGIGDDVLSHRAAPLEAAYLGLLIESDTLAH